MLLSGCAGLLLMLLIEFIFCFISTTYFDFHLGFIVVISFEFIAFENIIDFEFMMFVFFDVLLCWECVL